MTIPAGTTVMVLNGAAGRDPRRFDEPDEFRIDRDNAKEHLAFGRGPTPAPEGRWPVPRPASASSGCSARMGDIAISESAHGPGR